MINSARCTFQGSFPETRPHRAEGRPFAEALAAAFALGSKFDLWKDCGWIVFAPLAGCEVNVFLARYTPASSWELTIAIQDGRSFLDRLLRRAPESHQEAVQIAAFVVHQLLTDQPGVSDVRWSFTGDPRKAGVSSPEQLQWPRAATGNVGRA
ncbi:hypothetical protein GCM10027430_35460 [Lysobacter tyrosinilyticus]